MSIAPSQILYLEHGPFRLYAEAIQVVVPRRLCWARPTLLIQGLPVEDDLPESCLAEERQAAIAAAAAEHHPSGQSVSGQSITSASSDRYRSGLHLYDLEDCPDLIWPQELFEIAYDVDFFALLVQLKMNPDEVALRSGRHRLSEFLESFWRSQPQVFATKNDLSEEQKERKALSTVDA